jgi:hypothetical protein
MSLDIAAGLREESRHAREIATYFSSQSDRQGLERLAESLMQLAEKLERDARD